MDSFAKISKLARDGYRKKIQGRVSDEKLYKDRVVYELTVIKKLGFEDYFLIVWDFVKWARENKIRTGAGRGSAAGSLVSYLLDITRLDPVTHGLLFERFLNEGRKVLPDVDLDFQDSRRGEVVEYLKRKYGEDHVASVITYNMAWGRGVIRDVSRILQIPLEEVDKISKQVGYNDTLEESLQTNKHLQRYQQQYPKLFDIALKLQGQIRTTSQHAAGIVVTPKPMVDLMPVAKHKTGTITQWDKVDLEELGFTKIDLLSLTALTMIQETLDLIGETNFDIDNLPLDNREIYKRMQRGDTLGLFQFETDLNRKLLRDVKPDNFSELVACVSLGRPGAKEGIVYYIAGKFEGEVTKLHPLADDVLQETYGCIVYQEQSMKIASQMAGFSLAEADDLRRGIAKGAGIEKFRERWMDGCRKKGVTDAKADEVFEIIKQAERYSFNKSHATVYAYVAYQTAWLKFFYPMEFMSVLLSNTHDVDVKLKMYIEDAYRMGIEVLPVDINRSKGRFVVDDNGIRFGLKAVKGVGQGPIDEIVSKQPFLDIYDFLRKVNRSTVRSSTINALEQAGAFRCFGQDEEEIKRVINAGGKQEKTMQGVGLFGETDSLF